MPIDDSMTYILQTSRIGLRNWFETDLEAFAELNGDPEVMRYFENTLDQEESKSFLKRLQKHYENHGFTYYAAEHLESKDLLGFVGLARQTYESPFTPCVDIGWRLRRAFWGQGYATEAAKACLEYGFNVLHLEEIYATTPIPNKASEAVMKRSGMTKVMEFAHPKISDESPLKQCVVYRIGKEA